MLCFQRLYPNTYIYQNAFMHKCDRDILALINYVIKECELERGSLRPIRKY